MNIQKIAVIGGSGFVGSFLIPLLRKFDIINIDKNQSVIFPEITRIADVRNKESLSPLLIGCDLVILLAAEHRDDVTPISLYYDVNVKGIENVLQVMTELGINNIIFTSSVAVYGLGGDAVTEKDIPKPFNHYGTSKWQAEQHLKNWHADQPSRNVLIIRPTVIFGETNRGNVFTLTTQIHEGKFMMVGKGMNRKSISYVRNVVDFISFYIHAPIQGFKLINYVDKPDLTTHELVVTLSELLQKKNSWIKIPYLAGIVAGYFFDVLILITGKKLPISSIRIKKFCANTLVNSDGIKELKYQAPYSLKQGLENMVKAEFLRQPPS